MSDTRGGESVRVVSRDRLGCKLTMGALQGGESAKLGDNAGTGQSALIVTLQNEGG